MKISSAFIRANQVESIPKPDPWAPVDRSQWTGNIYKRFNVAFQFKYKQHIYESGEWVPSADWVETTYTNMPETKVANSGTGSLILAGDYQGMVPGLFYLDDSSYNPNNIHRTEYMLSDEQESGKALTRSSLTLLSGGSAFYGTGFQPGTYKLEIMRYFGGPYRYHSNNNLAETIVVEGLIKTHEAYDEDNYFDFDPTILEFEGYTGEYSQTAYRKAHVVLLKETHFFTVEHTYDSPAFSTCDLSTFCNGIRQVEYDTDGETEVTTPIFAQVPMVYLQDFNLYKLK